MWRTSQERKNHNENSCKTPGGGVKYPRKQTEQGNAMQKKVSEKLMIEEETAVKWVNAEPSPKWQSTNEEMGELKAKVQNILRFG